MTFHLWPLPLSPSDLHHLSDEGRGNDRERERAKNLRTRQMSDNKKRQRCHRAEGTHMKEARGNKIRDWGEELDKWELRLNSEREIAGTQTIYFGLGGLGNLLVWSSCSFCHVCLIIWGWQVTLITLTSVITTASHTLIKVSCASFYVSFINCLFCSLLKSSIINYSPVRCYLSKGNLEQANKSKGIIAPY